MAIRKIIHIDMDAFYASVEQRDNPSLRGRPVIVGGRPEGRGVVASCSYEARKFGVRSAMSSRKAYRLCPHAVFVRPDFSKYKEASRRIREIFFSATDLVEPLSLDEAYLDVTTNKRNEPLASKLAATLRAEIREQTLLTASAGVAPNKFLAKLASDMRKPDGLMVISPERVAEVLARLPVEKLWGVGPSTARKLHALGIPTTAELREVPTAILEHHFGRFGHFLHGLARGEDAREVRADREPKSRGSETTFADDLVDMRELRKILQELAEDVARGLAKAERRGQTLTLKVRYRDFTTITRSRTFPHQVHEAQEIAKEAEDLLRTQTEAGRRPIRLLGISISKFCVEGDARQLQLEL